ncbi:hypothetical protein F4818DRAFT_411320 [Hypoxylon cercidicola]|nr:hypothetical protein F4818DRAFT_411320 [Hypoxylon cercidicola]
MMAKQQQLLKFSVQHYRLKTVSEGDFVRWLHEEHVPVAAQIIKKHNIFRWSITLNPVALQQAFGQELNTSMGKPPGWQMADYDAVTNYWVRDPEDLRQLIKDEEWAEKVSAEELNWLDLDRASILAGFETVFIDDGQIITQKE